MESRALLISNLVPSSASVIYELESGASRGGGWPCSSENCQDPTPNLRQQRSDLKHGIRLPWMPEAAVPRADV